LFQLAGRRDWDNINPEARTGYGYGVAPGSSELWGQKLQERLAEEEFNLPEAEAARQMKMYELGGPERVAAITERGGLEKARMTGEFGLKGIESKGGQALNFLDMMNQARAGGANVSRFSVPGGPSVSFSRESELPTQLLQEVRGAKAALEASKDWKGSYAPEAQVSFDQTVQNALLRYPAEDSVKLFLSGVLRDPDYKNMNLDDIMQAEGYQEGEISPEDYQAASLFLSAIRGQ